MDGLVVAHKYTLVGDATDVGYELEWGVGISIVVVIEDEYFVHDVLAWLNSLRKGFVSSR